MFANGRRGAVQTRGDNWEVVSTHLHRGKELQRGGGGWVVLPKKHPSSDHSGRKRVRLSRLRRSIHLRGNLSPLDNRPPNPCKKKGPVQEGHYF